MSRLIESGTTDGVGFGNADETDAPLNVAGEFNVAGTLNLDQALGISGIVRDEANQEVANATVALIKQNGGSIVEYTQTDSNGSYEFFFHPEAGSTEENWHVAVYDDTMPIFNSFSKPYVSAALNLGVGEVSASANIFGLPNANATINIESNYTGISPTSTAPPTTSPVAFSNLVAWYPFDSAQYGGSNADDVTAILGGSGDDTAYDGTVNGATYQSSGGVTDISAGANSGAFDFDGTNDYIDVNSEILRWEDADFSITAWFKPDITQDAWFVAENETNWKFTLSSNNILRFAIVDNDVNFPSVSSTYSSSSYQHVVATHDVSTGTISMFKDGSFVDSTTTAGVRSINFTEISIGYRADNNSEHFDGSLDDLRVYDKVLSNSEVTQIYNNTEP